LPRIAVVALFAVSIYLGTSKTAAAQSKTPSSGNPATVSSPQTKSVAIQAAKQLKKGYTVDFKEFRLQNGLRVLLAEDHSAPT
jgi:hypothetical protein